MIGDRGGVKQQVHVYYSGRVQGIGFRFTAESLANEFGVTGWVKNLGGGKVELVAQAEEEVLLRFLDKIGKTFSQYIRDTEVDWLAPSGTFEDFSIRF